MSYQTKILLKQNKNQVERQLTQNEFTEIDKEAQSNIANIITKIDTMEGTVTSLKENMQNKYSEILDQIENQISKFKRIYQDLQRKQFKNLYGINVKELIEDNRKPQIYKAERNKLRQEHLLEKKKKQKQLKDNIALKREALSQELRDKEKKILNDLEEQDKENREKFRKDAAKREIEFNKKYEQQMKEQELKNKNLKKQLADEKKELDTFINSFRHNSSVDQHFSKFDVYQNHQKSQRSNGYVQPYYQNRQKFILGIKDPELQEKSLLSPEEINEQIHNAVYTSLEKILPKLKVHMSTQKLQEIMKEQEKDSEDEDSENDENAQDKSKQMRSEWQKGKNELENKK